MSAGLQRSRVQKKTCLHLRARLQIQTVSQTFNKTLHEAPSIIQTSSHEKKPSLCHRGDPLPTVEYTAEEVSTWWGWVLHVVVSDWRATEVYWCDDDVVFKGGRCTGSWGASTPVWPAGSSWTVCSSWRRSAATERTASLSSERSPPSWKVTGT